MLLVLFVKVGQINSESCFLKARFLSFNPLYNISNGNLNPSTLRSRIKKLGIKRPSQ
jgi:hypothetical protein